MTTSYKTDDSTREISLEEEWKIYLKGYYKGNSSGYEPEFSITDHNQFSNKTYLKMPDELTVSSPPLIVPTESSKKNKQKHTKENSRVNSTPLPEPNPDIVHIEPKIMEYISPIEISTKLPPECDELYISTKTKVLYFNCPIDIQTVFWKIPIVEYWKPVEGVIKKQIKIVSKTPAEFEVYKERIANVSYYKEHIIKQVDNPTARVLKYKDERKITIGMSKKDIINTRIKQKNAFYNCFVIIIRFEYINTFREIHVKVFNTGKMEIPGVFNRDQLDIIKTKIISIVEQHIEHLPTADADGNTTTKSFKLTITESDTDENVLINSNFNCGFYINRERLFNILSKKYGIETSYDPCSYPGVKCKYYFNNELEYDSEVQTGQIKNEDRNMKMFELGENKKYTEVSFMIFRTGSCLIVGNCSEKILRFIFEFLKTVLYDEYHNISIGNDTKCEKEKKQKRRKRTILLSEPYYHQISRTTK